MKIRGFAAALAVLLTMGLGMTDAGAKRLGGGKSVGMQRQAPAQAAPQSPPPQVPAAAQAVPNAGKAAAPAAAAAAPKRSWMGPLAGLAAGLGLAALAHSLGFGEGMANIMMMILLAVVAFVAIRFVMARMRGGAQPALAGAGAGASGGGATPWTPTPVPSGSNQNVSARSSLDEPAASAVSVTGSPLRPINIGENLAAPAGTQAGQLALPADFDRAGFERAAQMIFIRMQTAHDTADLDDLRQFTTPELFAAVRLDIQERGGVTQHTDVEQVEAQLIDFGAEPTRQVASVRYTGRVREESQGPAQPIDEIWHLVRPMDGSRPWAIAGIQQPN